MDENAVVVAELEKSPVIEAGKLTMAGAAYHLKSGEVTRLKRAKRKISVTKGPDLPDMTDGNQGN